MALLEVKNVKKIYTTRFGGNQVEALKGICGDHGGIRFWQDYPAEYSGGS